MPLGQVFRENRVVSIKQENTSNFVEKMIQSHTILSVEN